MLRRLAAGALAAALAAAFYVLLIDNTHTAELYVAVGVVLIAAVLTELTREHGFTEAGLRPGHLRRLPAVLARVPVDAAIVCAEALAQLVRPRAARGRFRAAPFRAGDDTPQNSGRAALAEALGSLPPNTIVIGIDDERDLILVHQLRPRGGAETLDRTELG